MTPEKWQRYIDDQCTEQEKKEILHYLQSLSPGMLEEKLAEGWDMEAAPVPDEIVHRMDHYVQSMMMADRRKRWKIHKWQYWAAAAVAAFVIGTIPVWQRAFRANQQIPEAVANNTIRNNTAHVRKAILPDSSGVWLAPHSAISFAADYARNNRQVFLQGEAYFEVAPRTAQPFVVNTGNVQTTVLGTHFNIEAYSMETATRVSLTEGKIAVKISDSTLVLTPGKRLVYRSDNKQLQLENFAVQLETDWKTGAIVLNDLPMPDVFHRLEQRFGRKIHYDPGFFQDKQFNATYRNADLTLILQNIAFVQDFRFEIRADEVFIYLSR